MSVEGMLIIFLILNACISLVASGLAFIKDKSPVFGWLFGLSAGVSVGSIFFILSQLMDKSLL
jgi:hypothetical protein